MKIRLLLLFIPALFLFSTVAHAQTASVLPNQPVIMEFPEHPLHAETHSMATERPLVGGAPDNYTYAHGEQPLWEFGHPNETKPLGDIAREFRQQKLAARKSNYVFEQEGSK